MKFAHQKAVSGADIKYVRKKMKLTQKEFADLINVSHKTVERWEQSRQPVTGPIVTLLTIFEEAPELKEQLQIPEQTYPLRLFYMKRDKLCTLIDVDERNQCVQIKNYTGDLPNRAFGRNEAPSYAEYEAFLESRCFPRERDKMKLMLKELNLPFYDPLLIIQKTEGRMAEDDQWIRVENKTRAGGD